MNPSSVEWFLPVWNRDKFSKCYSFALKAFNKIVIQVRDDIANDASCSGAQGVTVSYYRDRTSSRTLSSETSTVWVSLLSKVLQRLKSLVEKSLRLSFVLECEENDLIFSSDSSIWLRFTSNLVLGRPAILFKYTLPCFPIHIYYTNKKNYLKTELFTENGADFLLLYGYKFLWIVWTYIDFSANHIWDI